jgi:hypothetical protein
MINPQWEKKTMIRLIAVAALALAVAMTSG